MNGQTKKNVAQVTAVGGILISLWSIAAVLHGLGQVNWQVSELFRQYMIAVGMMQEFHTFVDFYTHVKGIEYLICLAFLVAFPLFYRHLHAPAVSND